MFPTLNSSWWNDIVLVKKLSDPLNEVKEEGFVGSVVCLRHPKKENHFLIKRLSALGGNYQVKCVCLCWLTNTGNREFWKKRSFFSGWSGKNNSKGSLLGHERRWKRISRFVCIWTSSSRKSIWYAKYS